MAEILIYLATASVVALILGLVAGAVENLPKSWEKPPRLPRNRRKTRENS